MPDAALRLSVNMVHKERTWLVEMLLCWRRFAMLYESNVCREERGVRHNWLHQHYLIIK